MKAGVMLALGLLLMAAATVPAQQRAKEATGATASTTLSDVNASSSLTDAMLTSKSNVIIGKNFQVSGPLVQTFKGPKLWQAPRRFLHLINPFASTAPKGELLNLRDYNPRAWASSVGWHPGASIFNEEMTHESSLGLVSIDKR